MKKNYLIISTLLISYSTIHTNYMYVDFQESMTKENPKHYQNFFKKNGNSIEPMLTNCNMTNQEVINHFEKIYEENNLETKNYTPRQQIPKIIHQIWLGEELPKEYIEFQETWLKYHPDWEYKLWTDEDVEALDMQNKDYFEKATNYAEKANIMRYEVLYKFGGLYVDLDFECYKPFDILNENYEFFCGIYLRINLGINNALIGSVPKHPVLKYCLENLETSSYHYGQTARSGPYYLTSAFLHVSSNYKSETCKNMIAMPTSYFYPIIWKSDERIEQSYEESFAIHYWFNDWHGSKFKPKSEQLKQAEQEEREKQTEQAERAKQEEQAKKAKLEKQAELAKKAEQEKKAKQAKQRVNNIKTITIPIPIQQTKISKKLNKKFKKMERKIAKIRRKRKRR